MRNVYSSDLLSPDERFGNWQIAVDSTYGQSGGRHLGATPFDGDLRVKELGGLVMSKITSSPVCYERDRESSDDSQFFISSTMCEEAYVEQDGRQSRQVPGDLVLFDGSRPYTNWFPQGDKQVVLCIPRESLISRLPQADMLVSRTLSGDSSLGRLATTMLHEALITPSLPLRASESIGDALLDVLATAFSVGFEQNVAEALRTDSEQLLRVKRYLIANLGDENLNLQRAARDTHLSTRTLSRMFAKEGTTFSRWLWELRLDECRRGLLQRKFRSVTEAALSCGFTNMSHFSRAFRSAYGITPIQLMSG